MKVRNVTLILLASALWWARAVYAVEPGMIHMCVRPTGVAVINNASDTCPNNQESLYVQRAIPGQRVAMGVLAHVQADDQIFFSPATPVSVPGLSGTFNTTLSGCIKVEVQISVEGGRAYDAQYQVYVDSILRKEANISPSVALLEDFSTVVPICNLAIGNHTFNVVGIAYPTEELRITSRSLLVEGW